MSKIIFGGNRKLKEFDKDITQYYKELAELWNGLEDCLNEPSDRRTKYYNAYHTFFDKLLYMWDMIRQTETANTERIKALQDELNKWTGQQTGRKKKLTETQINDIRAWKAEGHSNREIAKRLNVVEGTIRNNIKIKVYPIEELGK